MSACLDENAALAMVEGRLAPRERAAVERHLESCDACRELLAELARLEATPDTTAKPVVEDRSVDTSRLPFADVPRLPPGHRLGAYVLEDVVGSGSAGTVYRAHHVATGQIVALKHVTEREMLGRFRREAAALQRFAHDAIVRYIDHGNADGGMYLAMEWLAGEDLDARLRRGALGFGDARILGMRLASALAYAHEAGCVHRDVSPRNVFLPNGRVEEAKLLDFGLVRVLEPAFSPALEGTRTNAVLGTPFYMSPEQIRDPKRIGPASDLFSLGVILYQAISGKRPFEGEDLFTLWSHIVERPHADLRWTGAPAGLLAVVDALLAKRPEERPRSAANVVRALTTAEQRVSTAPMASPRVAVTPPPDFGTSPTVPTMQPLAPAMTAPPPRAPEPRPRNAGRLVAGGAALVAATALGAYAVGRRSSTTILRFTSDDAPASESAPAPDPPPPEPPPEKPPVAEEAHPAAKRHEPDPAPAPDPPEDDPSEKIVASLCAGSVHRSEVGQTYLPPAPGMSALSITGNCVFVLEKCTLQGNLDVSGFADVTLRGCTVTGTTSLSGFATLRLENTKLAHRPSVSGKTKLIEN